MVSQEKPISKSTSSSTLHQFLISDPIQHQFDNQHFNAYSSSGVRSTNSSTTYPEYSLGLYNNNPTLIDQSLSLGERMYSRSTNLVQDHDDHGVAAASYSHEMSHTRQHMMDLLGAPNEASRLSLSLGSQGFVPTMQQQAGHGHGHSHGLSPDLMSASGYSSLINSNQETSCNSSAGPGPGPIASDYPPPAPFPAGCYSFGTINRSSCSNPAPYYTTEPLLPTGISNSNSIGNSRYLKAVQSLLEEAVSVGGQDMMMMMDQLNEAKMLFLGGGGRSREQAVVSSELRAELLLLLSNDQLILPAEPEIENHQLLLIKYSKLTSLLEQVESRYEEYCQRMEELVSSFEALAGGGAAKTYTALALQAMSRHFCNLRDALVSQIKLIRKKLLLELIELPRSVGSGSGSGSGSGLSSHTKLSLFDREINNNRHIINSYRIQAEKQQQAWRPIRGLPETSVAILRAWLFEHFLHPYPNDSEKLILASQTGLTKMQVSNWFINARVRLWKPMIEEMYKEEFGSLDSSSVDSDHSLFSG
ncbi:hypothetical protein Dimus_026057 [Dionaea muscipula]